VILAYPPFPPPSRSITSRATLCSTPTVPTCCSLVLIQKHALLCMTYIRGLLTSPLPSPCTGAPDPPPLLGRREFREFLSTRCEKVSPPMSIGHSSNALELLKIIALFIVFFLHMVPQFLGEDVPGRCHKRQKPQAPTPQAPIRNRQTRKVANAKFRIG